MFGGLAAAGHALGSMGFFRIMSKVRSATKAATAPAARRRGEKARAVVVAKTALTPSIWRIELDLDAPLRFVPGQYVKLRVAPYEWRDYSIAAATDRRLTLLISNRTHGDGSNWAEPSAGEATEIEAPFGAYRLESNGRRKVFVATGTGVRRSSPCSMRWRRRTRQCRALLRLSHAGRGHHRGLRPQPERTIVCASRAAPPTGGFAGRVTQALARLAFDPDAADFYLCGSAAMVAESKSLLEGRGALHVLTEPYRAADMSPSMKNSWFTETEVFLLHEVVVRLDRIARKHVLDPRGVSYPEFLVAMAVNEMERPTQAEVGELLDMSKSLVSQRVGGLLAKGFLVQQREPETAGRCASN